MVRNVVIDEIWRNHDYPACSYDPHFRRPERNCSPPAPNGAGIGHYLLAMRKRTSVPTTSPADRIILNQLHEFSMELSRRFANREILSTLKPSHTENIQMCGKFVIEVRIRSEVFKIRHSKLPYPWFTERHAAQCTIPIFGWISCER